LNGTKGRCSEEGKNVLEACFIFSMMPHERLSRHRIASGARKSAAYTSCPRPVSLFLLLGGLKFLPHIPPARII
jgi:hypothetical protein